MQAQDEKLFTGTYCKFLCELSKAVEEARLVRNLNRQNENQLQEIELEEERDNLLELITREATRRFRVLYDLLSNMYRRVSPWNARDDYITRQRLAVHMQLMVLLHVSGLLSLDTLHQMRDTIALPLHSVLDENGGNEALNPVVQEAVNVVEQDLADRIAADLADEFHHSNLLGEERIVQENEKGQLEGNHNCHESGLEKNSNNSGESSNERICDFSANSSPIKNFTNEECTDHLSSSGDKVEDGKNSEDTENSSSAVSDAEVIDHVKEIATAEQGEQYPDEATITFLSVELLCLYLCNAGPVNMASLVSKILTIIYLYSSIINWEEYLKCSSGVQITGSELHKK